MEGGPLLTDAFKNFAKDYVLLLHITTQIPGKKHDGMLGQVGGRGFPSFFMLGSEGQRLAQADFRAMMKDGAVVEFNRLPEKADKQQAIYDEAKKKAAEGGQSEKFAFALMRHKWGVTSGEEFVKEAEALGKLNPEQRKQVNGVLANLEVQKTFMGLRGQPDDDGMVKLFEKFSKMHEAGRIPTDAQWTPGFYWFILNGAIVKKDKASFEKYLPDFKKAFASNPNRRDNLVRMLEDKLADALAEDEVVEEDEGEDSELEGDDG